MRDNDNRRNIEKLKELEGEVLAEQIKSMINMYYYTERSYILGKEKERKKKKLEAEEDAEDRLAAKATGDKSETQTVISGGTARTGLGGGSARKVNEQ